MDQSFFTAPVKVPQLSGFDKSFQNLYTAPVGTLVPALCDELMPGSVVDLNMAVSASLPPLASDTFMRCSLKVECFFVPMRLCYGGFEHFFVGDEFSTVGEELDSTTVDYLPQFSFYGVFSSESSADNIARAKRYFGAGSLADYLGCKITVDDAFSLSSDNALTLNMLPWIAYHKIWADWYRNSLIQTDCFARLDSYSSLQNTVQPFAALPYVIDPDGETFSTINFNTFSNLEYYTLADDVVLFDLRQRNFGFDIFTCATPTPTRGDMPRVTLDPTSLSTLGQGFTISQLRSMNSLAQFRDRNNLCGDRYVDRLYGQYGCRPSDGIAQRVLCLGSADFEVYSKGIFENAGGGTNQSPFAGQVGNRVGSAGASGKTNLCSHFKASEPGYLFVITSLVPRVTYAMGIDKKLTRYVAQNSIGEMANPILQNIGPEPIYVKELADYRTDADGNAVFGYTDRYGHFKAKFDELHGLLRFGESLESFAAQRYFDASSDPRIDSEFLEIPRDFLDNVTAVSAALSEYGVWIDSYFDYKVSMPLAKYSLPSLQDPAYEHGKTLTVRRGGFRF